MKIARYFAVVLALAWAVLASQPAYADQLCIAPTIVEGTSGVIPCTFTNNGLGDITILVFFASQSELASPDVTDLATLSSISGSGSSPCTIGETLSVGQSCGFVINLTTDSPAGETDMDKGVAGWFVGFNNSGGPPHVWG
jgi:hypothetical protein